MAPILLTVMDLLHMRPVLGVTEEVFSLPVLWIRENIPLEVGAKLLPKGGGIG